MIGNDRFVQVFGSVPAGDDTLLTQIVSNAVREGFHVVLCEPGTAVPLCTLPATKAKHEHKCGLAHVLSLESLLGPGNPFCPTGTGPYDPKEKAKVRAKVSTLINRVTKARDGVKPNIGVIPGPSGYVALNGEEWDPQGDGPTVMDARFGFWYWYSTPVHANKRRLPVLVPPSTIKDVPVQLIGQTSPAPQWLLERIAHS